jgi:hypothetical protein
MTDGFKETTSLAETGDMLRRSRALGIDREAAAAKLRGMKATEVTASLAQVDVRRELDSFAAAMDAAMEALLSEDEEERGTRTSAALQGLLARDRLASLLHAVEGWEAAGGVLGAEGIRLRDRMRGELALREKDLKAKARMLAGLNEARRRLRDELDEDQRARSWWYSDRAECDALADLFAGRPQEGEPHCQQCRHDREASALVDHPPSRHITEEELWAYDLGTLEKLEKRWITTHAAECAACKLALKALSDAEEAIEELSPARSAAQTSEEKEARDVIVERAEFRVLYLAGKRPRLVIEPRTEIAAIAVDGRKARRTTRGFELEIAAQKSVHLSVELASGPLEIDVDLRVRR